MKKNVDLGNIDVSVRETIRLIKKYAFDPTALWDAINGLEDRMTTAESIITGLQTDVSQLNNRVTQLQTTKQDKINRPEDIGAVPLTRTINGQALDHDLTIETGAGLEDMPNLKAPISSSGLRMFFGARNGSGTWVPENTFDKWDSSAGSKWTVSTPGHFSFDWFCACNSENSGFYVSKNGTIALDTSLCEFSNGLCVSTLEQVKNQQLVHQEMDIVSGDVLIFEFVAGHSSANSQEANREFNTMFITNLMVEDEVITTENHYRYFRTSSLENRQYQFVPSLKSKVITVPRITMDDKTGRISDISQSYWEIPEVGGSGGGLPSGLPEGVYGGKPMSVSGNAVTNNNPAGWVNNTGRAANSSTSIIDYNCRNAGWYHLNLFVDSEANYDKATLKKFASGGSTGTTLANISGHAIFKTVTVKLAVGDKLRLDFTTDNSNIRFQNVVAIERIEYSSSSSGSRTLVTIGNYTSYFTVSTQAGGWGMISQGTVGPGNGTFPMLTIEVKNGKIDKLYNTYT